MLFVELGLIRYTQAYVMYLAFFTNFVLLASFLGVGVGFLRAGARVELFRFAPAALAAVVVFVAVFPVQATRIAGSRQFSGAFGWAALPEWISLTVIFVLSFAVMAAIADGVARTFARFPALEAYRLDILGSILGIAAFSVLSFLRAPPLAWGIGVAAILGGLAWRPRPRPRPWPWRVPWRLAPLAIVLAILAVLSFAPRTYWSPYYRITTTRAEPDGTVAIRVNGIPHQWIRPFDDLQATQQFRFAPYRHAPGNPLTDVLIIGAGGGNDVAIALAQGAHHVDAVEIDPRLYELGRDLHPNHPYQDSRVSVHVDDGRAFLHDTDRRYDLVLFAIPDSLTVLAGQGSLRLESYLFTEQAVREVRAHLKPDGVLAIYHYSLPAILDRYASTMARVFGHAPCLDLGIHAGPRQRSVLTVAMHPEHLECTNRWQAPSDAPPPVTDDRPFPYLTHRTIPALYVVSLLVILLGSVVAVRVAGGSVRRMRGYLDLFFMGAAFLLLETKNVVQFALLFGTTWFVNALVFGGILLTVYLAIEVAGRIRFRRPAWLYLPLLGALAVAWAVPPDSLLGMDFVPRFAAAVALAFAPVFLANLVFAERFRDAGQATVAFGANLLGAMLGGVLEYAALVVGYRALLLVVAGLYLLALAAGRRYLAPRESTPPAPRYPVLSATRSAKRSA